MAVETEVITIPYCPRDQFEDFHEREQRWACIVAHRRAGKTVACINDLIRKAFEDGKTDGRYAYIAPFYSQAKAIGWDYLLRYSNPVRSQHNASELWVELINGARVRLFGADNPDALRGLYLDGVVLDEYADMRPRVWGEIIRPLLADRKGWAIFIGTPKGHNGFYDVWKHGNSAGWFVQCLRASETHLIEEDELRDAKRTMSEDQYEQEFECSFEAAILGAFYGKEMRVAEDQGRVTEVKHDKAWPVHTAWDLGYSDDTAIWWYQVIAGEIKLLEYHGSNGHDIAYYGRLVNSKPYRYGIHWLPHDARAKTLSSGGRSTVEQLAEHLDIKNMRIVPNLSVQDGIQAVRLMLARCVWNRDTTEEGVESLKQYQREFDEEKKVFRDKPLHDWTSHAADAFRMLAIAWGEEELPKAKKEPIFPIKGTEYGFELAPLETLWKTAPRGTGRI
jgi:phage terminase large subunit